MRAGLAYGIAANVLWGLFPVYFHALDEVAPVEVLAHRIGWSLVAVVALLAALRRLGALRRVAADRRTLGLLSAAAVLIAFNWGVYVYAVSVDHVVEAALGYFIMPLINVALGMLVFGERLNRVQLGALALGTVAVVELALYYGGVPWMALVLAVSFGLYGLLKKLADVPAAEGLTIETIVLAPLAAAYLVARTWAGDSAFATGDLGLVALAVAAGPVTVAPLVLFAACVVRVPLSTVGLIGYLTPVLQFLVGWVAFGEPMSTARWIGFGLVWAALAILTWDGLRRARAGRPREAEPEPAAA